MTKVKFEEGYGADKSDIERGFLVDPPTDMETEQHMPEVLEESDNLGFLGPRTGLAFDRY